MADVYEKLGERTESRAGTESRVEITYLIIGATDSDDAMAALVAHVPSHKTFWDYTTKLVLTDTRLEDEVIEDDWWIGRAVYVYPTRDEQETPVDSKNWNTTGGTEHITQSLQTIATYGSEKADYGGAIGVDDNNVNGTDIVVPIFEFSQTAAVAEGTVDSAYIANIRDLTAKVNSVALTTPFGSFAVGEVLFLGADAQQRTDGTWDISYRFAHSPNVTGRTVGSITGIAKKGWEHLWVRYGREVDTGGGAGSTSVLVRTPKSVNIERVYETADLLGLGLSGWS